MQNRAFKYTCQDRHVASYSILGFKYNNTSGLIGMKAVTGYVASGQICLSVEYHICTKCLYVKVHAFH